MYVVLIETKEARRRIINSAGSAIDEKQYHLKNPLVLHPAVLLRSFKRRKGLSKLNANCGVYYPTFCVLHGENPRGLREQQFAAMYRRKKG